MKAEKVSLSKRMIRHIKDNLRMMTGYRDKIEPDKYLNPNEPIGPFVITLENRDSVRKLLAFEKKHMAKCGRNSIMPCFSYSIDVTVGGDFWKVSCPCGAYIKLEGNWGTI